MIEVVEVSQTTNIVVVQDKSFAVTVVPNVNLLDTDAQVDVVSVSLDNVVAIREGIQVVSRGVQGPEGPAGAVGPSEDDVTYAKRVDFVGTTHLYRGEAVVGSVDSAAVWRIRKITFAGDGDVVESWAGGTADFDKVWDDRVGLSYS